MSNETFFLYDHKEDTKTRFVSFMGESNRYDLAITITNNFYGKKMVVNLQTNRAAIIGQDDLKEEGYIEHAFAVSEEEAEELLEFLYTII
ncbi:DUF3055 domain-containing protein [Ammoniphilus sp. CFH 90114]|uniref:DUF3055 domain-containing protein n=1 Tax=Ammoniphilus sp. CFH 90114 TaxID=2493665 RepID=UPI00100DB579|nr:DUF3055 domain-containing protein [Ammoniphilus sp. CFH 90114]RXT05734.1 DUF3055 domain-containing protein [Ammoniphilus sp. CFH 90114]